MHVLLVADLEQRIRFLIDNYQLTESEAEKAVKRADMIRSRFLTYFSDEENHDDPMLYTIALNMNHVSMEKAEELICKLISE